MKIILDIADDFVPSLDMHLSTQRRIDTDPATGGQIVTYMAADFLAASANRINAFNWHDCGTGTTAENVSQTALVTPYGGARQSGTQSNPAANQYRSVATLWFSSTLSIGEFGLFSAATAGTLWDRRLVAPTIGVNDGDSIQFTYTLTVNAG